MILDALEHLDRLDDAIPPEPDRAALARVRGRARHMQQRNRLAVTGAIVAVVAIAAGVSVVAHGNGSHLVVLGPGPETTAPRAGSTTSQGTLPNGLHVRLTVDTPTVPLGSNVEAKVVVTNDTGVAKTIGPGDLECALGVGPVLRDSHGVSPNTEPAAGNNCLQVTPFPPGKSATFTTTLSTGRVVLPVGAGHERFNLSLVAVVNPLLQPRLSALTSPPVAVDVIAPALTARLQVGVPTAAAGSEITGDIEFDNTGSSTLSAGCATHRNYQVSLAAGTVVLANPLAPQLDPDLPCLRNQLLLPPGTTRFPFKVAAKYYGCSPQPTSDPTVPLCVGHQPPALPAGEYVIEFKGAGAVGAVNVAPVVVHVVPGNTGGVGEK